MQILTSENLSPENKTELSSRLSMISIIEPAMFGRPPEFYESAFESNRLVVVVQESVTNIIGSGLLLPLADGWAEVSGVFVKKESRGNGVGNLIVEGVQKLANEQGLNLLLTMKPSTPGSEGMIIEATKNGFLPVSYDYLRQSPEVFRACCICCDESGSENCSERDVKCLLGVNSTATGARESTLRFIRSEAFAHAIPNTEMYTKILTRIINVLGE